MNTISVNYEKAVSEALSLIEQKARAILKKHSNLRDFTMGMGEAFFTGHNYEIIANRAYMYPVFKILDEWDRYLKLTGEPMIITAEGRKTIW